MNTVPKFWAQAAWPSVMPLSNWLADVSKRFVFISEWTATGKAEVVWFSGFFYPQAFLTGTLQNYARKVKVPIDKLALDFEISAQKPTKAESE